MTDTSGPTTAELLRLALQDLTGTPAVDPVQAVTSASQEVYELAMGYLKGEAGHSRPTAVGQRPPLTLDDLNLKT